MRLLTSNPWVRLSCASRWSAKNDEELLIGAARHGYMHPWGTKTAVQLTLADPTLTFCKCVQQVVVVAPTVSPADGAATNGASPAEGEEAGAAPTDSAAAVQTPAEAAANGTDPKEVKAEETAAEEPAVVSAPVAIAPAAAAPVAPVLLVMPPPCEKLEPMITMASGHTVPTRLLVVSS